MKTVQKKHINKIHRIMKTLKHKIFMDFETCGLYPFPFPQPFAFEGYKKGEIVVLDSKTKTITKVK